MVEVYGWYHMNLELRSSALVIASWDSLRRVIAQFLAMTMNNRIPNRSSL
jgi:hypothetical protein